MNAPFAHFLARFADGTISPIGADPASTIERVTLDVADLEARLEDGRREACRAADALHEDELATLAAAHRIELAQAVADAQALRVSQEGVTAAALIDEAFVTLRMTLSEQIADVLRPLLADALAQRTRTAVMVALDRILADTDRPSVVVRGPTEFITAIRAGRASDDAVEYIVEDTIDMTITAGATMIATKLGAALAALAGEA